MTGEERGPIMSKSNRKWKIYAIHHSHTDIGYTDRQEIGLIGGRMVLHLLLNIQKYFGMRNVLYAYSNY